MLLELTVENFAVIERARLSFEPGLNVITGETGAGKSLLVGALATVLGGRVDREVLRSEVPSARVEAVFRADLKTMPWLGEYLEVNGISPSEDGLLILAREIQRDGPNLCRINGRTVTLTLLRDVGQHLLDIHGQGEHAALVGGARQLNFLDAFGQVGFLGDRVAEGVRQIRALQEKMDFMESGEREGEQRRDLLMYQLEEIQRSNLVSGEEEALVQERARLANAQVIQEACLKAHRALYGGTPSGVDLLSEAQEALASSPDPEGELASQRDALAVILTGLEEVAWEVRRYGERSEAQPQRLAQVEERLDFISRLRRKYGGTVEEVLALAEQAKRELEEVERSDEDTQRLRLALEDARRDVGGVAWELSLARQQAATQMEVAMAAGLEDLGMGKVLFVVGLERLPVPDGLPAPDGQRYDFTESGIDRVEFRVASNPGEGLRPLTRIASGGEVSRLMLALKSALQANSGVATLVFDEIDVGIGGRAGEVVGRKLWAVSRHHQTVCVTHLAQIAAYADHHFRVDKEVLLERTFAQVHELSQKERIQELAAMLGGTPTPKAEASARELLRRTRSHKGVRSGLH